MTLDVRVEDLDCRLDEAAARKMLLVLDERQPRLQQLVVGLHVNHVVFIQLSEGGETKSTIITMRRFISLGSADPVTCGRGLSSEMLVNENEITATL